MKAAFLVVGSLLFLGGARDGNVSSMIESSIYDIDGVRRKLEQSGVVQWARPSSGGRAWPA